MLFCELALRIVGTSIKRAINTFSQNKCSATPGTDILTKLFLHISNILNMLIVRHITSSRQQLVINVFYLING